jgi:hypothetical protein
MDAKMDARMNARAIVPIVLAVVLITAVCLLCGLGAVAYNFGIMQGTLQSLRVQPAAPGTTPGTAPYPYYGGPFFHPWGFGFGLLGCLFPIFFFFLIFALFRFVFWGGRRYGHGWHRGWENDSGVPSRFEEWHRRAHEQPQPVQPTPQSMQPAPQPPSEPPPQPPPAR